MRADALNNLNFSARHSIIILSSGSAAAQRVSSPQELRLHIENQMGCYVNIRGRATKKAPNRWPALTMRGPRDVVLQAHRAEFN